jgi:transposase
MAQVQVITGPTRYRSWSEDQKRALVAAAFAPGSVVTDVARQADVSASLLYRWRRDFRAAADGFAEVVVAPAAPGGTSPGEAAIEIEFPGAARVRIPPSTPPILAVAVVKALARR